MLLLTPTKLIDVRRARNGLDQHPVSSYGLLQLTVDSVEAKSNERSEYVSVQARVPDGRKVVISAFANRHHWTGLQSGDPIEVYARRRDFHGRQLLDNALLVRHGRHGLDPNNALADERQLQSGWGGTAGVWLRYPGVNSKFASVTSSDIARSIAENFDALVEAAVSLVTRETLIDEHILARRSRWPSLKHWLLALHLPQDPQDHARAMHTARLLAALAVSAGSRESAKREPQPSSSLRIDKQALQIVARNFARPLTACQSTAIKRLTTMLSGPYAMRALLEGDVATGKSLVMWSVAIAAAAAGSPVAVIVPRKLLLDQSVNDARALAEGTGVTVIGYTHDSQPIAQTGRSTSSLASCIHIGTSGLASQLERSSIIPGLQIVDEQQVLGVTQRERVLQPSVNQLEVSATAQPRTLALAELGGVTRVRLEHRPNPPSISTQLVTAQRGTALFEHAKSNALRGIQVAVVYPRLQSKDQAHRGAIEAARVWSDAIGEERVCVLTGQLDDQTRSERLSAAVSGDKSVIIGTTALELGLNLPLLRLMIIVDPQDFGLSQLHQLRGRIARMGGTGQCYLMPRRSLCEDELKRLEFFCSTSDGGAIARFDLDRRGPGWLGKSVEVPLSAVRQSGKAGASIFANIKPTARDIRVATRDLASAQSDLVGFRPTKPSTD